MLSIYTSLTQGWGKVSIQTYLAKASWLSSCCCCGVLLTSSKVKGRAHKSLSTGLTHWLGELDREMLPSASWGVKTNWHQLKVTWWLCVQSLSVRLSLPLFLCHWGGSSSTCCIPPEQNIGDATPHIHWSTQTLSWNKTTKKEEWI